MALDLNEYIKMSYERPNRKVLEGLGASEGLIEYLMETPGNTNWNVVDSITNSGGEEAEVWLVGNEYQDSESMRTFVLSNADSTDHLTELATNGANYKVFLNGVELPYFSGDENESGWSDTDDYSTMTKSIEIYNVDGTSGGIAAYKDPSTAPTSVEVSVKAK